MNSSLGRTLTQQLTSSLFQPKLPPGAFVKERGEAPTLFWTPWRKRVIEIERKHKLLLRLNKRRRWKSQIGTNGNSATPRPSCGTLSGGKKWDALIGRRLKHQPQPISIALQNLGRAPRQESHLVLAMADSWVGSKGASVAVARLVWASRPQVSIAEQMEPGLLKSQQRVIWKVCA